MKKEIKYKKSPIINLTFLSAEQAGFRQGQCQFDYDANGNNRYANENTFDRFTYNYAAAGPNQLSSLVDAATDYNYKDIKNGTENFVYDAKGQMTERTTSNGLKEYVYDVYGKVKEIYPASAHL